VGHLLELDISPRRTRKAGRLSNNVKGRERRKEPEEENRPTEKHLKNI
jgi:hypothetical protein